MAAPARARRPYAPRLPAAERREQLLDAALELICERGYAGVSIDAIARAAGVSRPVVYDSFANLGELLRALLEREERRTLEALAAALPVPPPPGTAPGQLLVDAVEAFARSVVADPGPWRLILLPAEGTPREVRAHVEAGRRTAAAWLEQLLAWGAGDRPELAGLDVELSAQLLVNLGEGLGRVLLTEPDRYPPERLAALARGLAERLLGGSGPRLEPS